jgi:hypothetical protein
MDSDDVMAEMPPIITSLSLAACVPAGDAPGFCHNEARWPPRGALRWPGAVLAMNRIPYDG